MRGVRVINLPRLPLDLFNYKSSRHYGYLKLNIFYYIKEIEGVEIKKCWNTNGLYVD